MQRPDFKFSPNAYAIDVFKEEAGVCDVCGQTRNLKYDSSFYSVEEPEYLCPWCIADGSAAKKYNGEFNDYAGIEGAPAAEGNGAGAITKEDALETGQPCAFLDYADSATIRPLLTELEEDIEEAGFDRKFVEDALTKDGWLVGYLFQCLTCKTHRLHIDCD